MKKQIWVKFTTWAEEPLPANMVADIKQQLKQNNDTFFIKIPEDVRKHLEYLPSYYGTPARYLYNLKEGSVFNDINPINIDYLAKFLTGLFTSNIDLNCSLADLNAALNSLLDKTIAQWLKDCSIQPDSTTWPAAPEELVNLILKTTMQAEFHKYFAAFSEVTKSNISRLANYDQLADAMDELLTLAWGKHRYTWHRYDKYIMITKAEENLGNFPEYIEYARAYLHDDGIAYKYAITDEDVYKNVNDVPDNLFINKGFMRDKDGYFRHNWDKALHKILEEENLYDNTKYTWDEYDGIIKY